MKCTHLTRAVALVAMTTMATAAHAAFIVETDNVAGPAGKANDHFSTPGGSFALAAAASSAAGLTGNQSANGNPTNTVGPDVYVFRYTPGPLDPDNTTYTAAQVLGNSQGTDPDGLGVLPALYVTAPQLATGLTGGQTGLYNVYFTTPTSVNVNPAGSKMVITHDPIGILTSTDFSALNQNDGGTGPDTTPVGGAHVGGANNLWLKVASLVPLTQGTQYTLTLTANVPSFVSQRAHGVMWEYVGPIIPEPATFVLAGMGLASVGFVARRRVA